MRRMIKNNLRSLLLVIITAIICINGTVYAVEHFFASDIGFTPSTENQEKGFTATNVEDALDELYSKKNKFKFLAGKMTEDEEKLSLTYISQYNGKILVQVTHVKGNNNSSIVKLNGVEQNIIDTNSYLDDSYRKLKYTVLDVKTDDQIMCETDSISANGAELIWSYSSCSIYLIQ